MASKYSAEWWRQFELMSAKSVAVYDGPREAGSQPQQQEWDGRDDDDARSPARATDGRVKVPDFVTGC